MEGSLILPLIVLLPLVGAIVSLGMTGSRAGKAKLVALGFSLIDLVLVLYIMLVGHYEAGDYNFSANWIDTIGLKMSLILTVDGLSILMLFLTAFLMVIALAFSYKESDRPNTFFALLLIIEFGLMGVYTAADYFLFYIMWEVTLIPMFFLISWYGGPRRHYSAIKFFIYTHVASLVMMIGIFALVFQASTVTGVVDFSFDAVLSASQLGVFGHTFQYLVFGLLFFGFLVKMPSAPFHTWLPDAHTEAPTAGSVLLAGVMLKMGSYGIIRICFETLPDGAADWQWVMIAMGLFSSVYGAYACIAQRDLKKMVAYSSVSHMGMVMLAMGLLSPIGIQFAVFQMFAHGLVSAMLFMVCGWAGHSIGTREIPLLGGLASKFPKFAGMMMFCFMASLGLPGLIGFWGEFGIIMGFYEFLVNENMIYLLVIVLLSLLLTAGYYLWAMQRTLFGHTTTKIDLSHAHDLSRLEFAVLGIIAVAIVAYGLWPDLALHFIDTYVVLGV